MKKTLAVALTTCFLALLVACSSSGSGTTQRRDFGEPEDIKLSAEEIEYEGVHVRLPESLQLEQSDNGEYYSVNNLNEPITGEVLVSVYSKGTETDERFAETVSGKYTPEEALILYAANSYEGRMSDKFTFERKMIAGTDALITRRAEGDYDIMEIELIMNSKIVTIQYNDRGGRYGDLIQESIDTIRIDESEIPEIARTTSPEGLKAAGLREQPWEIECDPYGVYVNMPEDYTPVKRDDGIVWVSPDGQTVVNASTVSIDFLLEEQQDIERRYSSTVAGFEGIDQFTQGSFHGMYCTELQFWVTDPTAGRTSVYVIAALPWRYGEQAVMLTVVSTAEATSFDYVIETLRMADGWNNGDVLDVESIAVSE